jgi:hypothetical protein
LIFLTIPSFISGTLKFSSRPSGFPVNFKYVTSCASTSVRLSTQFFRTHQRCQFHGTGRAPAGGRRSGERTRASRSRFWCAAIPARARSLPAHRAKRGARPIETAVVRSVRLRELCGSVLKRAAASNPDSPNSVALTGGSSDRRRGTGWQTGFDRESPSPSCRAR